MVSYKYLPFYKEPRPEVVAKALKEARESLAEGGVPSRILPTPGEDWRAWSPGETRAAALLAAHLWGTLRLELEAEADLRIFLRLEDIAEELGLGKWVRYFPKAYGGIVPSPTPLPAKEAALRIAQGKKAPGEREEAYLVEVARYLRRYALAGEIRQRVEPLVQLNPRSALSFAQADLGKVMGRIRNGKPVAFRGTEAEREALVEKVVERLLRAQEGYFPRAWRWGKEEAKPHPRAREALNALWAIVKEAALERELRAEVQEGDREGPHKLFLSEEARELARAVGLEPEGETLQGARKTLRAVAQVLTGKDVERLLEFAASLPAPLEELSLEELLDLPLEGEDRGIAEALAARVEPFDLADLSLLPLEEDGLFGVKAGVALVLREWRRLEAKTAKGEAWYRPLVEFLKGVELLPQKELKEALARAEEDREAKWAAAAEAALGALEVLVAYPSLREDLVSLAWELGLEAVEKMRSPYYHPGAYAWRKARERAGFLVEVARQKVGVDERTARKLAELRRILDRDPGADADELAMRLRAPKEWIEDALLFLRPASLEDPIPGTEDLTLGDAVEGGEDPADAWDRKALVEAVNQALEDLEPPLREAVELRVLEARPMEEAARLLDLSEEEVEARVALALNQLRYHPALLSLVEAV